MHKISDFIVDHCYVIFGVFLVLVVICGLLSTQVKINKDIYSYMPADSETTLGLNIMNDEFNYDSTSSYEMMLTDVPENEKIEIKNQIETIEGVKSVDYDSSDNYNRDNYTRFVINVDAPADSETAERVYDTIHDEYKERFEIEEAGQVYSFNGEVMHLNVTLLAVGCAMVILTLMSQSFVEPWLFLFAILLAVIANKGTNIIFPNVSHITDAISAILQMALSMDYAIMLSTRYRQEKEKPDHPDKKTAMRHAMRYSFGAIMSSSVTTVVGLIVLVFMSFTIGRDMGLVLSKGVVLSLVSIFTSLPALLLIFDKLIDRTKKKTLTFKMDWFGKRSFSLRKIAVPVFLLLFAGSFILKGSTAINFTTEQNNRIKDVFGETNQMALVYDAKMDDEVTKVCQEFDKRDDTKRVLCYGNTINEPEKYNELVAKINSLGSEKVEMEDYLVKAIYYHYFKDVDAHEMSLGELVNFLQEEVFPNKNFSDSVSSDMIMKVERLSNFTDQRKVNYLRNKQDIVDVLGVDGEKLDDVFVLYLSEQDMSTELTLYGFSQFVTNDVLTNAKYSSMVSAEQRTDLAKLRICSDESISDAPKSAAELAEIFGIEEETLERLLVYYNYVTTETPTTDASAMELVDFALSNQNIIRELNLSESEAQQLRSWFAVIKNEVSEFDEVQEILAKKFSYSDVLDLVSKIDEIMGSVVQQNIDFDDEFLKDKLSELKNVYKLLQAENTSKDTKLSPRELVNFLLEHQEDEELKNELSSDVVEQLSLAQYVMNNQGTKFSAGSLAQTFGLDEEKVKLVYALYNYCYENADFRISLKTLINFINEKIIPNPDYADRLSESERTQLMTIANLMHAAENGNTYNYEAIYRMIRPLAEDLDKNQLFLAYLYHGSLEEYDENWTLTVEQFIGFVADKVMPDSRFAERIDDEMRERIVDGRKMVSEAKNLLVGPQHYRALIETDLPAEGEQTFALIGDLKNALGPRNKLDYYMVGDSAMAYEMSQTFNDEMNFITILTMLAIFVVVVCTFKSLFVSILLVLVIQCAVFIVMAYLSLTGSSIFFIALIIVQSILMGATIDYAILFTSYYVENRSYYKMNIRDALISTYNRSINAVLTSASILIIVTAIVGNMAKAIAAAVCQAISLGTFCATLIILVLLPALLATLDRFIIKKK